MILTWSAAAGGLVLLGGVGAWIGLIWRWAVTPVEAPDTWSRGELARMPAAQLREPCPICRARHCAGCEEPARVTSGASRHVPRHDWAEVPPSISWLAGQVSVALRATLITRELVGRHVWRPVDPVAFQLWARRKLGRPLQLGQPMPAGRLP